MIENIRESIPVSVNQITMRGTSVVREPTGRADLMMITSLPTSEEKEQDIPDYILEYSLLPSPPLVPTHS